MMKTSIISIFCFILVMKTGCAQIKQADLREFIHVGTTSRDLQLLEEILERTGHVDARDRHGNTLLYLSALNGFDEFVGFLLLKGADPTHGKSGRSALHAAAQAGHLQIVEKLLDSGLDVDIRCSQMGITPLMSAARNARGDIVALLLERGAAQLVQDKYHNNVFAGMGGTFPSRMDSFTFNENVERTITLLAKAGADVNHESRSLRRTPLMQMCYIGSEVGVKTFLKFGADPLAVNRNGQSVLDFADGNESLIRLIKKGAGALKKQETKN